MWFRLFHYYINLQRKTESKSCKFPLQRKLWNFPLSRVLIRGINKFVMQIHLQVSVNPKLLFTQTRQYLCIFSLSHHVTRKILSMESLGGNYIQNAKNFLGRLRKSKTIFLISLWIKKVFISLSFSF